VLHQLRARPKPDAAYVEELHTGADPHQLSPERGSSNALAGSMRRLKRCPGLARICRQWMAEYRRRLPCGTTPAHIKAIAEAVRGTPAAYPCPNRSATRVSAASSRSYFAGLPLRQYRRTHERHRLAEFSQAHSPGQYEAALAVVASRLKNGAQIIDVNMTSHARFRARHVYFLHHIPRSRHARVPIMIDSSNWK